MHQIVEGSEDQIRLCWDLAEGYCQRIQPGKCAAFVSLELWLMYGTHIIQHDDIAHIIIMIQCTCSIGDYQKR